MKLTFVAKQPGKIPFGLVLSGDIFIYDSLVYMKTDFHLAYRIKGQSRAFPNCHFQAVTMVEVCESELIVTPK